MEPTTDGEQLWRLTLQHSPVGMALVAPDGYFVAVNEALCTMLGYDAATLRSMTFPEITHADDVELDVQHFEETLSGDRTSYRLLKRYLHSDGHVVWGDLAVALLRDHDGSPIHFISQIIDVTEREQTLQRLAIAEATINYQRLMAEAVYNTVDVGLILIDASGRYEAMNRRHGDFMRLAYPDGHAGRAGQVGYVYAADGVTLLTEERMPSYRAVRGEEFDDFRLWAGSDPVSRVALSVSARSVRDADDTLVGAALCYKDVTDYVRALEAKDEFVASVSHELRTPLTSVLGHLEMVADSDELPPGLAERVAVVERNAVRLRQLVADLLQMVQDESGLPIVRTGSDLTAVVEDAVEAARPIAASAGLTLETDLPDRLDALVDANRLRQVVDNLVSNAIKYSGPGGTVRVALSLADDQITLAVTDSGIGIEPADLDRLFTRFYRGTRVQELRIPGTGLGLTIVRSIVEAHGGEVTITSEVGVGSTVSVTVPYAPDSSVH